MSAASIAAEVEGVRGVSLSVLRPYVKYCIKLVSKAIVPEERLKMMHKKACIWFAAGQ